MCQSAWAIAIYCLSSMVKDLGVVFDECLTLDAHISNICRRVQYYSIAKNTKPISAYVKHKYLDVIISRLF